MGVILPTRELSGTVTINGGDLKLGLVTATASPVQLIIQNWSSGASGCAQIIGGWQGSEYWGIGTDSSSGDMTLKIGVSDGGGTWQSTQANLLVNGGLTIAPGWSSATLANGWTNYDGAAPTGRYLRYRKIGGWAVQVTGTINNTGTPNSTATIFTLPAGYTPSYNIVFLGRCYVGSTSPQVEGVCEITVSTSGAVNVSSWFAGSASYVHINASIPLG